MWEWVCVWASSAALTAAGVGTVSPANAGPVRPADASCSLNSGSDGMLSLSAAGIRLAAAATTGSIGAG